MFSTEQAKPTGELRAAPGYLRDGEADADETGMAQFGATLAHELRGPLAPIANGMTILKATVRENARAQETLAMMERQLAQLISLLDDLMDVGAFRSSHLRSQVEHVDLHHVISASVEACAAAIDLRRQDVTIESDGNALLVRGDQRRLTQVFTNLLANSNKYTPIGGHISVKLRRIGAVAVVEVCDDGVGMTSEDQAHIFELFNRGAAHRYSPQRGLGIGLAVVKNIVQLHGGTVVAHSEGPGKGSVFTVGLPLDA